MAVYKDTLAIIGWQEARMAGLKRYFTGKPCKRGHICERASVNGSCMMCLSEKSKASYYKNHETMLAKQAARRKYDSYKVRMKKYQRDWYLENSESVKRKAKEVYWRDPVTARAKRLLYRVRTKEAIRKRDKEYQKSNRHVCAAAGRRYRARMRGAKGSHTAEDILVLLRAQRFRCAGCGSSIKRGHHADHIVPLKLGGSNSVSNIQMLCQSCNCSKGAKDPIDWAKCIGRLL